MKGLILKDFLCLRKTLRSALIVAILYLLASFMGVLESSAVITILMVVISVQSMNCFSYDSAAKWDIYAGALPVSPVRVVGARYCTVALLILLSAAISLAAGGVSVAMGRQMGWDVYLILCVALILCTVANAIMLPLMYKFGAERARVILLGAAAGVGGAIALLLLGLNAIHEHLTLSIALASALPALAALLGAALLCGSFALSVRFYKSKDL